MTDLTETRQLVIPQTLKGFRDLFPEDLIARNRIVEKIRTVYEKYGYVPLDTPVLEHLSTLVGAGGEEANKQMFCLESPEHEPVAMRFDLTVGFARLIAQYPEKLRLPFRRYQVGPVFRADDPQPGRFRQFTQFDIDAAGSESVAIDAEIVAAMCEVMRELGLCNTRESADGKASEFLVRINNRKLVDALLGGCGIRSDAMIKHVLRVVDKLQKIGPENMQRELGAGRVDDSGDPIKGVGLPADTIDRIVGFISTRGQSRHQTVDNLSKHLPDSPDAELQSIKNSALQEMRDMADALDALRVPECDAIFDPSLARGLEYYTGPVFEAFLLGAPKVGSVMGGGRYDKLVARFMEHPVPATGVSIGLDRLIEGLSAAGKLETTSTTVQAIVLSTARTPIPELLKVAATLREEGIPTTVYFPKAGVKSGLGDQFSYANSVNIPVAVILGEDEVKNGTISVKNLRIGLQIRSGIVDREEYRKSGREAQVTVDRSEMIAVVKRMLSGA